MFDIVLIILAVAILCLDEIVYIYGLLRRKNVKYRSTTLRNGVYDAFRARCMCGQSDGHDDAVLSRDLECSEYDLSKVVIRETRRCDICGRKYVVLVHYERTYEKLE